MTGRTPACEDTAAISARLREIQRERMARIAGCECPPDGDGGQTHRPGCVLEPRPAALALAVAMERLRARRRRPMTADEIYAEGIAAKYARHRVLS